MNWNSKIIGLLFLVGISHISASQSRMYVLTSFNGGTEELGVSYYDSDGKRIGYLTKFATPGLELAVEKRIAGSLYAYTGLSFTQFKSTYQEPGISQQSQVNQSFVGMPLLLRLNSENRNNTYFDFGIVPTFLTKAYLKESDSFDPDNTGLIITDEGDVAKYIPRWGIMYKMAFSVAVKRVIIGSYLAVNLANVGNGSLPQNWKVDSSIFMSYNSKPVWATYGLHIGFRIK